MANLNLKPAQQKMLASAFQCFDVQPKVDYVKLAELTGLKNAASAKTGWCSLKKSLLNADPNAAEEGEGEAGSATPKAGGATPKGNGKGAGKKRKATEGEEDEGEERADSVAPAPKKVVRKAKAAKKAFTPQADETAEEEKGVKKEDGEEDGEVAETIEKKDEGAKDDDE